MYRGKNQRWLSLTVRRVTLCEHWTKIAFLAPHENANSFRQLRFELNFQDFVSCIHRLSRTIFMLAQIKSNDKLLVLNCVKRVKFNDYTDFHLDRISSAINDLENRGKAIFEIRSLSTKRRHINLFC